MTWGLAGCNPPASSTGSGAKEAEHDHHHDHAHHGPHGGHIMEIGEEEYHAEWTHDSSGKVTFYILDAAIKKEVPISAEELEITVTIGENEPATYKLAAVNPQEGKSAVFETTDKNLEGALGALSERVTATINKLTIGDKTFENVKIEEHSHGEEHKH